MRKPFPKSPQGAFLGHYASICIFIHKQCPSISSNHFSRFRHGSTLSISSDIEGTSAGTVLFKFTAFDELFERYLHRACAKRRAES